MLGEKMKMYLMQKVLYTYPVTFTFLLLFQSDY